MSMARAWISTLSLLAVLGLAAAGEQPKASEKPATSAPTRDSEEATVNPVPTPVDVAPAPSNHNQFWFGVDYLGWWLTGSHLPPLITASPPDTSRTQSGVLGALGTQVLFGGESVNDDFRSGVRFRVGGWLDESCTKGFELRTLCLDGQADRFVAGSPDGSLLVSRPFVDARTPRQNAELVSFPGVLAGARSAGAQAAHLSR